MDRRLLNFVHFWAVPMQLYTPRKAGDEIELSSIVLPFSERELASEEPG